MRGLEDSPAEATSSLLGVHTNIGVDGNPLGDDVSQSLSDTLREAVERHGERVVLLCSFQKEESVLLDELLRIGDGRGGETPIKIATIDTGVLFPETLQTWKAFEERYGIAIEIHDASNSAAPWTGPEHCCSVAKVAALEGALANAEGWITGIRREQGPTRADTGPSTKACSSASARARTSATPPG